MNVPPVVALPGWVSVQPFPALPASRSFVSGAPDGDRLRVAYFARPGRDQLFARAWFGPGAEGPPRHAHGGAVAAVLDEAMGACCWAAGHQAVAARLGVDFLEGVPLGTDAVVEAWIDRIDGRKVHTRATLRHETGETLATADGLFVVLTPDQLQGLARTRRIANSD
ncbi:MAG: PaaI family thioesterase [Vicinamibacterales bacterium]|nr:PaaI family thioesterase [Vicinamibacterales bacterium]